jgi:hypothetical protein
MDTDKYEKIKVAQYKPDWVECPKCKVSFNLKDRSQWTGMIHKACGQRLEIEEYKDDLKFIWCLKANVTDEETNRFKKGTKVFLFPPLWGDGYESIKVIGKDKETGKFIEIIINHKKLTDFKAVKVTKPDIISRMSNYWHDDIKSKELAEELSREMNKRMH